MSETVFFKILPHNIFKKLESLRMFLNLILPLRTRKLKTRLLHHLEEVRTKLLTEHL